MSDENRLVVAEGTYDSRDDVVVDADGIRLVELYSTCNIPKARHQQRVRVIFEWEQL